MTFKETVSQLLQAGLQAKPSIFLISLEVTDANVIKVVLDGDNGVLLQDCIDISRAIEHNLDKETIEFSLEVSSAGAASPLTMPRQYVKNIGRNLKVITKSGTIISGELANANESDFCLEWQAREPKKIGKGKETVQKQETISYTDVKEATVIITF